MEWCVLEKIWQFQLCGIHKYSSKVGVYVNIWGISSKDSVRGEKNITVWPRHEGGWLVLYKYHTIIRIYGFEEEPYTLTTFLTIRVLAMEYIIPGDLSKMRYTSDASSST